MESSKDKLIKLNKIMLIITTFIAIVSLVICFYFKLKVFPFILVRHKQEFVLFLCMIFLYFLSNLFKMKKIKKIIMVGIFLSVINLVGFRIINFVVR